MSSSVNKKIKKGNRFLTALSQFFNSDWFMLFYTLIIFLSWRLENEYIAVISSIVILCYMFLTQESLDRLIMVAIIIPAMVDNNMRHRISYSQIYILAALLLLVVGCAIYHFIKVHKKSDRKIRKSQLFIGYSVVILAGVLGGLGYEGQTIINALMAAGVGLALFGLYVLLYKCTDSSSKNTVFKAVVCLCILIVLQMLTYFMQSDDFILELTMKSMSLGWAITNSVAVILAMGIPLCVYLAKGKKFQFPYMVLASLFYVFIFLTNCRSMILAGTVIYFITLILSIVHLEKWQASAHLVLAVGLAVFVSVNYFHEIFGQFFRIGFSDNGRFELYKYYWGQFKENKLFGMGFFTDTVYQPDGMVRAHNTIIQILASTGIIGALTFVPMYFQRYKAFFTKISWFKAFAFLAYLAFAFYGMVDCAIISSYKLIIVYLLLFAVESDTIEIKTKQNLNVIGRK